MKKEYSGFPGDCSEQQLKVLEEFRTAARNMGCADPPYDDAYLLRFLRARKFDLTKALQMWTNFIKWRHENKIDDIGNFAFTELDEVRKHYPHGYFRTDRKGRPIYIERVGRLKITQLFNVTTQERLVQYYCQSYETLLHDIFPACSRAAGAPVVHTVTILDLAGSTMSMMSKKVYDFIQLASKIAQDNYPEILGQMFIVNAPMLFTGIWTVIKAWIDDKTKAKIKILGSKYQKELFEVVDPNDLPDFLGGKVPESEYGEFLQFPQGPWVEERKKRDAEEQKRDDDDEEDEDAKAQFSDLKSALSGLKVTGNPNQGISGLPEQNKPPVDTPLNTQVEGDDDQ